MKVQNQVIVAIVLAICVYATTLIYDFKEGSSKMLLGLDLRSGSHIAVELLPVGANGQEVLITKEIQDRSIQVFRKRLDPEGNKEVVITPEGLNRLIIEIPEVTDLAQAEAMVKKAGRLEFREAQYDPATGTYIGPDGQQYTQSDLAQTGPKEKTWQTMLTPPGS